MVVAQAQKIEIAGDRIVFTFSPIQRALRDQFEQQRTWLESIAEQATGRKWTVASAASDAAAGATKPAASSDDQKAAEKKNALREQALADTAVQTMLEVFSAEIRDVEEM
jgi:hypothetical protein